MTESMIERMRVAFFSNVHNQHPTLEIPILLLMDEPWLAAIAAMRDSTVAMDRAADVDDYVPPSLIWQKMIDAAIKENSVS